MLSSVQVQGDHFSGKPEKHGNVREFVFCQGIVRGMSGKNLVRENCYNGCMVWVADTDYDMINAKTQCNHGTLASKKC